MTADPLTVTVALLLAAAMVAVVAYFMRTSGLFWTTIAVIAVDQIIKTIIVQTMRLYESIPLIGDVFKLTYTTNPGMAFGIQIGPPWVVTAFAILATVLIFVYVRHVRGTYYPYRMSLSLILGGAFGNIIDRVFYGVIYGYADLFRGEVVDFVHVDLYRGTLNLPILGETYMALFPIWNVADMAIVAGVVGFMLFQKRFQDSLVAHTEKPEDAAREHLAEPGVASPLPEPPAVTANGPTTGAARVER